MRRILVGIGIATLISSAAAAQNKFWFVCGGSNFSTCAAVRVGLTTASNGNTDVTMRVWNLSGLNGSASSSVFTWIGFHGTGVSGVSAVTQQSAMAASSAGVQGTPAAWYTGAAPSQAGGIRVQMATTSSSGNSSINNSLANQCNPGANPGGNNSLWLNPCFGSTSDVNDLSNYVTLKFQTSGQWDLTNTNLLIQVQNGPNGMSTQCITGPGGNCSVVPEPITMVLLGSGLLGVGAARMRRRRKDELG